ncbi:hypothetical protein B0T18DRAFT_175062 [Schizothecium vesticola]|uniref:Uncharacterized protein n=1 Tax=Schizothecium vesticola TaxID=314040 RepID=A0AA40K248_9PEZI|nr:hypothetical protein B0T18DRAFT_175062 [Schizothecium vesticola]
MQQSLSRASLSSKFRRPACVHCPEHRRPTNLALYIAPVSLLSVDVHPDEPNFRVELFGQAPSRPSLTRRLNPDRLDHKVDQLSRPVSPVRPNHPQAPQRSASQLPLPRSHSRRQHESIPLTSRTWRLLEHSRESRFRPIHAASSAPRAPDRQRPPFPPRSLARDSKGPLPRPVCRPS